MAIGKLVVQLYPGRQWIRGRFRGFGSRSIFLLLIWEFIIGFSLSTTIARTSSLSGKTVSWVLEEEYFLGLIAIFVSLPVVILLAEVVISRYKLVSYSLRAIWLLSIVDCIISLSWQNETPSVQIVLIVIPQHILFGACLSNAVQLGIDQITAGSNTNITAYIRWLLWVNYTSTTLPFRLALFMEHCIYWPLYQINMLLSFMPVLLLSVGLILDFFLSHKLVREPVTVNPVTLIFKVLKYAAKHKHPVRRSAFTYCENERPSRLDNGKSKYGGPFTTEQVEDVKTFWRILLVLIVVTALGAPIIMGMLVANNKSLKYNVRGTLKQLLAPFETGIYLIPLYELLVYPCLRNRGPRILQSVGIGAAAVILASLYGLTAETLQYFYSNGTTQCIFSTNDTCFFIYIPHNFIIGFATIVLYKSGIEFISAQAPYNMKGFLIGFACTLLVTYSVPGIALYGIWQKYIQEMDPSKVGIWFFLTTVVMTVVLSLIFCVMARRYKPRERDEITCCRNIVEEIYSKYQEQEATG